MKTSKIFFAIVGLIILSSTWNHAAIFPMDRMDSHAMKRSAAKKSIVPGKNGIAAVVNLPEVVIYGERLNPKVEARVEEEEVIPVVWLPEVEISAVKNSDRYQAVYSCDEDGLIPSVQLPEVLITAERNEGHVVVAAWSAGEIIASVSLPEVVITPENEPLELKMIFAGNADAQTPVKLWVSSRNDVDVESPGPGSDDESRTIILPLHLEGLMNKSAALLRLVFER